MSSVDYRDGRDAVSGEIIPLFPQHDTPEHFTDATPRNDFAAQATQILTGEERERRLRDIKLRASIGMLLDLITEAQNGSGHACSRVVQAATSDLIIAMLGERLKEALSLIPGHAENARVRTRIATALDAAGIR
ncbi:hypothetical protein [Hyphomicrobium sp. CS1GBMeth3]|uniref:hypothetical protein n=1 Tax=Hyphomicrobium sp. CS1GBMeth3 TaxID=1892845 RepID=UPI0009303A55|nr:hypothetical protein [Hyphomicrobium sp. CS1GBMeth3]